MVVVNNVLLGRYWPRVGPQEALFTCILRRVAEGDGGGEQRTAGPLLAACGTPGDALLAWNAASVRSTRKQYHHYRAGKYIE
jgi:hypothetical protein